MAIATAYAEEVKRVQKIGVKTGEIAQATGSATATVTAWARSEREPTGQYRRRLLELVSLIERLAAVMDARYVPLWLQKPVPALNDGRPLDALAKGQYRRVSLLVAELENESFS